MTPPDDTRRNTQPDALFAQDEGARHDQPLGLDDAAPHYAGHRERLRARFKENGSDSLADYEVLELLLFRALPRRDTKPLAKELLRQFGSLSAVLGAPLKRLTEVNGIGETVALELKLVQTAGIRLARHEVMEKPILASWSALLDYCRTAMAHEEREQFRILFLDKKNRLIADEVQQTGTVDHTPVYPREVIRRALELSATALILVHNHPSGDPTPSRADVEMTIKIKDIAEPMSIKVHDHIIVGKENHASLKGMGLM